MDSRTIDAKLFALKGADVIVRVCYGSDPAYLIGTLRESGGVYTLEHELGRTARFTLDDVRYVELGRGVVELNEGAGEYWPPVM